MWKSLGHGDSGLLCVRITGIALGLLAILPSILANVISHVGRHDIDKLAVKLPVTLEKGMEKQHMANDETLQSLPNHIHDIVTSIPWRPDSPVPKKFYAAPRNCNPHNYKYLINHPHLCLESPNVFLLIFVKTKFSHFDRRRTIRETWGMLPKKFPQIPIHTVFLFGLTQNQQIQDSIEKENMLYSDIIQEDFDDSSQTSILKTVMAFKWARTYCPYAKYVMLMNDDVIVDFYKLVPFLKSQLTSPGFHTQFTVCYYFPCCAPVSLSHGKLKYQIEENIYGGSSYPAFCSGSAFVAPSTVIHNLYLMSLDTPSFVSTDVWVGILAEKLGVQLVDTHEIFAGMGKEPSLLKDFMSSDYFQSSVMVGVTGHDFPGRESTLMHQIWQSVEHHHKKAELSPFNVDPVHMMDSSTSGILYLTVSLMLVDMFVVVVIFFLIFYKRGHRKK